MESTFIAGGRERDRRSFCSEAMAVLVTAQLGLASGARAAPLGQQGAPFGPLKQISAGLLEVGYVEVGPADGPPVILLHGWPYDIHSFVDVAPLLSASGFRVLVPICGAMGRRGSARPKPSAMDSLPPLRRISWISWTP